MRGWLVALLFLSGVAAAQLRFDPPAASASTVSAAGRVWLTRAVKGGYQSELQGEKTAWSAAVTTEIPAAAFSSDGRWLAYTDTDAVKVLDLQTKSVSSFKYRGAYRVAFFGNSLLLASHANDFLQGSSPTGTLGRRFRFLGVSTNLEHLALSNDGKRGVLLIYDHGGTLAVLVDFTRDARTVAVIPGTERGSFTTCALNATGSRVACGGDEGSVALMDPQGKITKLLKAFPSSVQSLAFSSDGGLFVSSETGSLKLRL